MSIRKPHQYLAGYLAERRNPLSAGHTIILDCKLAELQGTPLVDDYSDEGGRYQVTCDAHARYLHTPSLRYARQLLKDATVLCLLCRSIAGEIDPANAGFTPEEEALVIRRRNERVSKSLQPKRHRFLAGCCVDCGQPLAENCEAR